MTPASNLTNFLGRTLIGRVLTPHGETLKSGDGDRPTLMERDYDDDAKDRTK